MADKRIAAMTPIEQDKELLKLVEDIRGDDYGPMSRFGSNEEAADFIKQLITADRKRVALEARLDELEDLSPGMYYFGDIVKIDNRIAELKAQQEEV